MAEIRPFRGILYNTERVGGLATVVGPPEDVRSREQAEAIVAGHPYHAVRLETPDLGPVECFGHAETCFRRWLEQGILTQSSRPAFYAHEHTFIYAGERRSRRGVFAALRLAEPEERIVLPHEGTLPHYVELRTALLRQLQANLSAVYTLIADQGKMAATMRQITAAPADIEGTDSEGGHHRIWEISGTAQIWALRDAVARQPLFIADGHHRYAAALAYRDELLAAGLDPGPADWVLAYIADATDLGILVLPIHRVVRGLGGRDWPGVRRCLERYFASDELPLPPEPDAATAIIEDALAELGEQGGLPGYLLVAPGGERLLKLRLRDWAAVEPLMPPSAGPLASHLDVTVLDAVVLRHILGFDLTAIEEQIEFTRDPVAAYDAVRVGQAVFAALVRPTPLQSLLTVARSGARMPQKSTYFYPKIPIGLLMRDLCDLGEEERLQPTSAGRP